MARDAQCTEVVTRLRSVFPSSWLEEVARETGWQRRCRKVLPKEMFWTLVLGFGCGAERTIASLRRRYEMTTGTSLVPSSFYDRFTPQLVKFLRRAVEHGLEEVARCKGRAAERMQGFVRDIVGIDSTVLRLHAALARRYPGTRMNHSPAAAKLHLVTSVIGRGPRSIKITDGRTNDGRVRFLGPWVRDHLLLFDLGYYSFRTFANIDRHGGYFVSRLKDGANPTIRQVLSGAATELIRPGASLQTVLASTRRDTLDLHVELSFRRRVYAKTSRGDSATLRVVAVRHPETGELHVYVTNIPAERLTAQEIAATYAGRWAIETIFKELKSHYRLDELASAKAEVVEALILTAVLTLIVSRTLLHAIAEHLGSTLARRLRPLRWAKVFATHASTLLALILEPRLLSQRARARWLALLKHQAIDPNVARQDLTDALVAVHFARC